MTDHIVKFAGDEGRDRSTSPSLNAPHSYHEALVAVLLNAQREMGNKWSQRTKHLIPGLADDKYPFAPNASETQHLWLTQAYAEGQRHLERTIEVLQRIMREAGEDVTKYD